MLPFFPLKRLVFLTLLFISFSLHAQVKLAAIFSDNMVLQRDKPVFIWGKAHIGSSVTVSFSSQQKTAIADTAGKWKIELTPLQLSVTPQDLTVKGDITITLHNILVGDVWLCSGQSNMEYPMDRLWKKYAAPKKGNDVAAEELANPNKPDAIRYIYVERTLNKIPELPSNGWVNGNDTIVRYISAIGYFFAKEIYQETKVPIGIISSSWGGTRIEEWTPDWMYLQSPVFKDSASMPGYKISGMHPGQKYKGLIEPLIPFAVKGVLWYQGETNCMMEDQSVYPEKFRLLVNAWRDLLKDDKLPFYTVEIAPHLYTTRKDAKKHTPEQLAKFWEAQTKCLEVPNTSMIVTTDLVDNLADIHPSYKWIVAHRLALMALAKTYKKSDVIYSGPLFHRAKKKKDSLELSFSYTGGGLASSDDKPLTWFSIAGEDEKFVPANAVMNGNKVIVSSPEISHPKYVRFAWDETAQPNFINKEGLPALPFRTDHLKID